MKLGLVLLTEGTASADLAPGFAAARAVLRPGDTLLVTDSGSDPELSAAIDTVAQPEFLPPDTRLTVLRFGATPPGSRGAQANAALAEARSAPPDGPEALLLLTPADHLQAAALNAARDRMAASEADILLAGGLLPPPKEAGPRAWLGWALDQTPAPALLRQDWLQAQALRLPESGPSPDWLWHWRLCATARRIGWQADPISHGPRPAPLPCDADSLLALHQGLLGLAPSDLLPDDLAAEAHGWLVKALTALPPALPAADRWQVAQRLAERLRLCPAPLWQEIMARHGHRQSAAEADALRHGRLLEVVTLWTQTATEVRLAALETGLSALQQDRAELAALRRGIDSLCRIAEYEALTAGWRLGDMAKDDGGRTA